MAESAPSPESEAESDSEGDQQANQTKTPSLKDKKCPYCHQQFTSSSLGRHLDQFLSKKKPDGIHDVDEIRRQRGGITRRTARNSKKEQHDGTSARSSPAAQGTQTHQQDVRDLIDKINAVPPGGLDIRLNRLNWQSTGVITDPTMLNPASTAAPTPSTAAAATSPNLKKRSFSTFASDLNPTTLSDTARALELSLREVLDSLRSASKHITPSPSPFNFDIQSQTFPALCLHLLPTPPTLYQASPFSTLTTCPISSPGPDQVSPLRTKISSAIDMWKWNALRLAQRTTTNIADEADFLTRQAASYSEVALKHLDTCYQNWMAHPPDMRDLLWHVELLRAYQNQKNRAADIEEEMERLQQEANQLQQQVEYLSQCQWPREMALWPPERQYFDKKMREELRLVNLQKPQAKADGETEADYLERLAPGRGENVNTRGDKWDFDKLMNKWRMHVREDRNRKGMFMQQNPQNQGPGRAIRDGDHSSIPAELKRAKTEGDEMHMSNGGSPVNGIVNIDKDGKEQGERRAPRRNLTKNITFVSDW